MDAKFKVGQQCLFSGQSNPQGPKIYPVRIMSAVWEGLGMGWIYSVETISSKPEVSGNNYEHMLEAMP